MIKPKLGIVPDIGTPNTSGKHADSMVSMYDGCRSVDHIRNIGETGDMYM